MPQRPEPGDYHERQAAVAELGRFTGQLREVWNFGLVGLRYGFGAFLLEIWVGFEILN